MDNKPNQIVDFTRVRWPKSFIGKWVVTIENSGPQPFDLVGTNSIFSNSILCFESEEIGRLYLLLKNKDEDFMYNKVVQIKRNTSFYLRVITYYASEDELNKEIGK